jgi:hypothetical protein
MTTEQQKFQWSDILSFTQSTYDTYLKLDRYNRDKYMKFKVEATVSPGFNKDMAAMGESAKMQILDSFEHQKDMSIQRMLLKQMKYHCGKPLKLSLKEKGPAKHIPIIDYFERNRDYLADYDYMIIDQRQYATLIEENFLLFQSHGKEVLSGIGAIDQPLTNVGKLRNLDVFAVWEYPDKDLRSDEFDVIIGKRNWIEADLITAHQGETHDGYINKYLMKMSFPVKRGFMRLKAEMKA